MKVKIKLENGAVMPKYAKEGDAGMDLTAISYRVDNCYTEYDTGISVEIPEGFVGLVFPRSSISNTVHYMANAVGVIDSTYRGTIKIRMKSDYNLVENSNFDVSLIYKEGDRVGQLIIIPYPKVEFTQVEELSSTERGTSGFGSTNSL